MNRYKRRHQYTRTSFKLFFQRLAGICFSFSIFSRGFLSRTLSKSKSFIVRQDDRNRQNPDDESPAGRCVSCASPYPVCICWPRTCICPHTPGSAGTSAQLIAVPSVPDAVPDGIGLKVQGLVNLDAVTTGRYHIQPAADACLIVSFMLFSLIPSQPPRIQSGSGMVSTHY